MALDRTYLAKLLGMMGSRHDGEVLVAARSAHRLVEGAGVTWEQVLATSLAVDAEAAADQQFVRMIDELMEVAPRTSPMRNRLAELRAAALSRKLAGTERHYVQNLHGLWCVRRAQGR